MSIFEPDWDATTEQRWEIAVETEADVDDMEGEDDE